jgi:hypothetical protein
MRWIMGRFPLSDNAAVIGQEFLRENEAVIGQAVTSAPG